MATEINAIVKLDASGTPGGIAEETLLNLPHTAVDGSVTLLAGSAGITIYDALNNKIAVELKLREPYVLTARMGVIRKLVLVGFSEVATLNVSLRRCSAIQLAP